MKSGKYAVQSNVFAFYNMFIHADRNPSVTLSPVSDAARGLVSDERGLSLRFPRFVKVREDKSIGQASTSEFLASIWRNQQGTDKRGGADAGELIDTYLSEELEEEDFSEDS